jgi:GAF domain-containing protein
MTDDMNTSEKSRFQPIVEAISRAMNLPASLWIPDENGEGLFIDAAVGFPAKFVSDAYLRFDELSLTGEAYITGEVQSARDLITDPRWRYKDHAQEMGWKAALAVPVKVQNEVFGVITIMAFVNRDFSDLEKQLLTFFTEQVELTIESEQQQSTISSLFETSKLLAERVSEKPIELLKVLVERACAVVGADCAVIYPYGPNRQEFYDIESVAAHGLHHALELKDKPRSDKGMAAYIKTAGELVLDNIEEQAPEMLTTSPFIMREGIKAFMGISLEVPGQVLGVLYLDYRKPHRFSEEEKNTIRLFAHQAATALNNARLYQQISIRAEALKALHEVNPSLISLSGKPEELRVVLRRIAKSAQAVLGADLIDLYQYHQNLDEFDLPPIQIGKREVPKIVKDNILEDDILYRIITLDAPKYTIHAPDDEVLTKPFTTDRAGQPIDRFVIREKVKASAAIPLKVGHEKVGVMFANFRKAQFFAQHQKELIEIFAGQAAIAIQNYRLYKESLSKADRLDLVHKVAAAFSETTTVDGILQLAVNGLAKVFGVKQSAAVLFDENGEFGNVIVEYLEPGCISALGFQIPLKNNPQIDKIVATKKPLIVDDIEKDEIMATMRETMAARKTLSIMIVPIIMDNEVVGTIGVDAVGYKRRFAPEEAALAQAIANQATAAIRIARQLDQRVIDILSLQEITQQMHQGDMEAVLNLIAERAVELTGAKHGGVWLLNRLRTALNFGGLARKEQYKRLPPNIRLNEDSENSINKWVVRNGLPYLCNDVRKDKNYKKWYPDTRSELTVPILYQGRVIGTINVESIVTNGFNSDHLRLLEAMAGQAAVVVQNKRLLDRLNVLDDVGVALTSGIRLKEEEIVKLIYRQAKELTGAEDMYIALYAEDTQMIRFPLATEHGERVEYGSRKADWEKLGRTEDIILTQNPILDKTKEDAERWYRQPGHQEFVGLIQSSYLGVPIKLKNRVLGVIAIYDVTNEYAYDEQDLQVFSSMANQVAIALDLAALYDRRLAVLSEVGVELNSGIRLKEQEIVELIYEQARRLFSEGDMYIALYDEDDQYIRFVLATERGKRVNYPNRMANWEKRGKTEDVIYTRHPILHKSKQEAEIWYKQSGHQEFWGIIQPSWLGVPMVVGDHVLGVIALNHREKEFVFDEQDLQVVSSIASQAATALVNARLYSEARGEALALKQLGTLGVAMAALQHRINNTLNIIIPNVSRLRERVDLNDSTIVEILDIIERNVQYTSKVVSRIQDPLKEVDIEDLNINAIIQDVATRLETGWKLQPSQPLTKIILDLDDSIPLIRGLSGQIAEVFNNLLDNAHKVMPMGGVIRVSTSRIDNVIYSRVIDSGSGIPDSIQERLFKKPVPSSKSGGGAGLGLWLSQLMLQSIGGEISIETSDSSGTTMRVMIPVAQS